MTSGDFLSRVREDLAEPERTRSLNRHLFTLIAPQYDRATRYLSLGRDACWKNRLVERLPAFTAPVCIDLACGTGDLTRRLAARYPGGTIIGLDLTSAMLEQAQRGDQPSNLRYASGDMGNTGLPDGYADIVTGSYALRNAGSLEGAIRETHRILKPGGVAAFLDFSKPVSSAGQRAGHAVLSLWGRLWGWVLHRDPRVYAYIADSLVRYPDRQQLAMRFRETGFTITRSHHAFAGLIECLQLEKRR